MARDSRGGTGMGRKGALSQASLAGHAWEEKGSEQICTEAGIKLNCDPYQLFFNTVGALSQS